MVKKKKRKRRRVYKNSVRGKGGLFREGIEMNICIYKQINKVGCV